MTYPIRPLPLGRSCSYRQRWRLARQLPRCGVGRPRRAPHGSHRRWGVLSAPAREVRPPTRRPRSARVLGQSSPEPAANARPTATASGTARTVQAPSATANHRRVITPEACWSARCPAYPFRVDLWPICAATARPPGSLPRHRPSRATRFISRRGSPGCRSTSLVRRRPGVQAHVLATVFSAASLATQNRPRLQAVGGPPSLRPPAQVRATPHAELLHRPLTHDCGLHAWASCVGRQRWGPGGMPPYTREGMF